MPGPPPKHPSTRRRRNKVAGATTLSAVGEVVVPRMPPRGGGLRWLKATRDWWLDVFSSPMSAEWDESDIHNVTLIAHLVDDFYRAESPDLRKQLAAEIRLQRQALGLSPLDRRRLSWEIDRGEEADARRDSRRSRPAAVSVPGEADDARQLLA